MLEKFLKKQKRSSECHPLEKPLAHDRSYEYHHKKAVLEDGRLYDTESAKKVFTDEASLEYIALGRAVQRVYFLTPNGNWFSTKEEVETESGITDVGDYRIQVTKTIYTHSDLQMEQKYKVKDLIGRNDYELYKEYFGEVKET
jgi:hypothetical protein